MQQHIPHSTANLIKMHFPLQEFTRNISAESIYCKAFTRALKKISKKIKKVVAKKNLLVIVTAVLMANAILMMGA
ncbi:MAG: hypothetical protein V8R11_02710 [Alphaproteobacteria bacterium]